jgi:hypothetical protein
MWRCQNSGPQETAICRRNAILGTPQASSARLTLEARTVRDVRRSTPLRLDARGRKDASAEPKELFSRGPQMSIRPYGSSRGIAKASWGHNARDRRRGLARPLRLGPQRVRSIPLARSRVAGDRTHVVGSITSAMSAMPTAPMRSSFGRAGELGVRFQARNL